MELTTRKYAGTWTALLTPFKADGALDHSRLEALVKRQANAGVTGISPTGTTGESPTTTSAEDARIFETAVSAAAGKIKVMAGTGSNNTQHAIEYTQAAQNAGADCCMVVTPYYNKPTPAGLKKHYWMVADVGLPVIIYNIKGRTGLNIETDTLMEIAEHEMVVGVKEASGDLQQIAEVVKNRSADFTVLSGDDAITLELMKLGGDGVVSVASNIIPAEIVQLVKYARSGEWDEATKLNTQLDELFAKIFVETNPIPVKYCAYKMDLCELIYRLPLCPPTESSQRLLDRMLRDYKLLESA